MTMQPFWPASDVRSLSLLFLPVIAGRVHRRLVENVPGSVGGGEGEALGPDGC